MYSIFGYGRMIADNSRRTAYAAALQQTIKPGAIVADIGTGPGFFALLACQLGARQVYAIEPDNVIQVARESAILNGFENGIEFIQEFSTAVTLPEPVDIIISDLRGVLPWFRKHLPSIQDARSRLLALNGILIPKRDMLWAAAVEVEEKYAKLVGPWHDRKYNLVLTPALKLVTNSWSKTHIKQEQLLGSPVCWHTLEYSECNEANVHATFSLPIERSGIIHGFAVWFDSEVSDGIWFSNAPGNLESIYGNAFFPFPQPVAVTEGNKIDIRLRADLIGVDYVWQWETTITKSEEKGSDPIRFKQSTLSGTLLSQSQLRKRSATHVPELTIEGQIEYFIMSRIDGKSSVEEIAHDLSAQFPDRFKNFADALDLVADLSSKYSN